MSIKTAIGTDIDLLTQDLTYSLHINPTYDYDAHVRIQPFTVPKPLCSAELDAIEYRVGEAIEDDRLRLSYADLLTCQTVFMTWYMKFQAQFSALMHHFATLDLPDDALRKILEYLRKLEDPPAFLEEDQSSMTIMNTWLGWGSWPENAVEIYLLIADWVLNLPFPDIPWETGVDERKDRQELWAKVWDRAPKALSGEWVMLQEALAKNKGTLDIAGELVKEMEMMQLG